MTWKSTAAAGAMVAATWLASHAPVGGPREPASAPAAARTDAAAAAIKHEADRLHQRLREAAEYRQPTRNPFRFNAGAPATEPRRLPTVRATIAADPDPTPEPFRLVLSGIGEDGAGDEITRTAIISTLDDVHVVKVGDSVAGYTVAAIGADSVDLQQADGAIRRLTFRP